MSPVAPYLDCGGAITIANSRSERESNPENGKMTLSATIDLSIIPPMPETFAQYLDISQPNIEPTPIDRVREALARLKEPAPIQHLRKLCGIRMTAVCSALAQLSATGEVSRDARGYQLKLPFPVSRPIDPKGNGNGKP